MSVEARGQGEQTDGHPEGLPLRWALILAIAAAAGIGVGMTAELLYGVGTAVAVVGVCHRIVR